MSRGMYARVVLLCGLVAASGCAAKKKGELPTMLAAFEKTTQVDIHLWGDPNEKMPKLGKRTEYGPPSPELVVMHLPVIEDVLMSYPAKVRETIVPDVWLLGKLQIGGKPFLGVAHPAAHRFDLAIREGSTAYKLQCTLHHELAHMIQGAGRFDRGRWKAVSADAYVGYDPKSKWEGKGRAYLKQGFVSAYASKNLAEDFAEMAELAFTHPDRIRVLYGRYPLIRRKMNFLTLFYERTLPGIVVPWHGAGWEAWVQERLSRGGRVDPKAFEIEEGGPLRRGPESS